jgi:hypothetical protein
MGGQTVKFLGHVGLDRQQRKFLRKAGFVHCIGADRTRAIASRRVSAWSARAAASACASAVSVAIGQAGRQHAGQRRPSPARIALKSASKGGRSATAPRAGGPVILTVVVQHPAHLVMTSAAVAAQGQARRHRGFNLDARACSTPQRGWVQPRRVSSPPASRHLQRQADIAPRQRLLQFRPHGKLQPVDPVAGSPADRPQVQPLAVEQPDARRSQRILRPPVVATHTLFHGSGAAGVW